MAQSSLTLKLNCTEKNAKLYRKRNRGRLFSPSNFFYYIGPKRRGSRGSSCSFNKNNYGGQLVHPAPQFFSVTYSWK